MRPLIIAILLPLIGCGPSKAQLKQSLGECRAQGREKTRLIKEYIAQSKSCPALTHPEQEMGAIEYGIGGH